MPKEIKEGKPICYNDKCISWLKDGGKWWDNCNEYSDLNRCPLYLKHGKGGNIHTNKHLKFIKENAMIKKEFGKVLKNIRKKLGDPALNIAMGGTVSKKLVYAYDNYSDRVFIDKK